MCWVPFLIMMFSWFLQGLRSGREGPKAVESVIFPAKENERTAFRARLVTRDATDENDVIASVILRIRLAFESGQRVGQKNGGATITNRHADAIPFAGIGFGEPVRHLLLTLVKDVDCIAFRDREVRQTQAAAVDRKQNQGRVQRDRIE